MAKNETVPAAHVRYVRALCGVIALPLVFMCVLSCLIWLRTLPPLPGLLPGYAAWFIVSAVFAARARSVGPRVAVNLLAGLPIMAITLLANFQVVRVDGYSMEPSLRDGDILLVDLWGSPEHFSRPGHEVYVLDIQGEETSPHIKRLAGDPGRTMYARFGRLFASGYEVHPRIENPSDVWNKERPVRPELWLRDPLELGADEYFVLGDNPAHSRDSRHYGPISAGEFRGRVVLRIGGPGGMGLLK